VYGHNYAHLTVSEASSIHDLAERLRQPQTRAGYLPRRSSNYELPSSLTYSSTSFRRASLEDRTTLKRSILARCGNLQLKQSYTPRHLITNLLHLCLQFCKHLPVRMQNPSSTSTLICTPQASLSSLPILTHSRFPALATPPPHVLTLCQSSTSTSPRTVLCSERLPLTPPSRRTAHMSTSAGPRNNPAHNTPCLSFPNPTPQPDPKAQGPQEGSPTPTFFWSSLRPTPTPPSSTRPRCAMGHTQ